MRLSYLSQVTIIEHYWSHNSGIKVYAIAWAIVQAKPQPNAKACAKTTVGAATTLQHGRGLVCCYSNSPGEMPMRDVIVTSFYLGFSPRLLPGILMVRMELCSPNWNQLYLHCTYTFPISARVYIYVWNV